MTEELQEKNESEKNKNITESQTTGINNISIDEDKGKESFFPKFVSFTALIVSLIAMIVIIFTSKNMNRKISSLDSVLWALDRKVDNEINSIQNNIDDVDKKVDSVDKKVDGNKKSMIIAELKKTLITVRDIAQTSTDKIKNQSDQIGASISQLIGDIDLQSTAKNYSKKLQHKFGTITVEPEGHVHSKTKR